MEYTQRREDGGRAFPTSDVQVDAGERSVVDESAWCVPGSGAASSRCVPEASAVAVAGVAVL